MRCRAPRSTGSNQWGAEIGPPVCGTGWSQSNAAARSRLTDKSMNDLHFSPIGLGCWQLGGDWARQLDDAAAHDLLTAAVDAGVRFFDTADVYGDGRSERLIGEFLRKQEHDMTVATKFGRAGGVYPDGYTETALREAVDASRERLGVEQIDLLQLHCIPTAVMRKGRIFNWLRQLQSEGLIGAFGASVETIEEGLLCMQQDGIASLQIIFNVLRQRALAELIPAAAAREVAIIARVPLASGVLSGKFGEETSAEAAFAKTDHRHFNRDGAAFNVGETFGGLPFGKAVEFSRKLETDFLPDGMTMPQFALRWVLDQPGVTTVIPGASTVAQVEANAAVMHLPALSDEVLEGVSEYYEREVDGEVRGGY